jgi:SnoaL-like domain
MGTYENIPGPGLPLADDEAMAVLLAERTIQRVLTTYSRAVDRWDFERLYECYWPEGTDDHGSFVGRVDAFVEFVRESLKRFERTNHFLGNMLIDVDLAANVARAETYAVAYHRFRDDQDRETDMVAGLRYIDRFERRDGEWRIAHRACAYEWRRTDLVVGSGGFADAYIRGVRSNEDDVYAII